MISHPRINRQIIDASSIKMIGIGGAGATLLERIALDGADEMGLLLLNADIRVLNACVAPEKIQLGKNLLKGLGAGGDPDLGKKAALESELSLRNAIKGQQVVFLSVGLGGGTGSGAAPIVAKIAREEGAFVVAFATMPFAFEGKRRRQQAEDALAKLSAHANALITFDNNRMGEMAHAKAGAHDAFAASDQLICDSIRAITRIVTRPGLIHLGLDDLIASLGAGGMPCLFGYGSADGKDRASVALRKAFASPLLDQSSLSKHAQTVLVHVCGGEGLTLLEIELLMEDMRKFIPEEAHLFFGAAIDAAMGASLTVTLISASPQALATHSISEPLAADSFPALHKQPQNNEEVAPLFELDAVSSPETKLADSDLFVESPAAPVQATESYHSQLFETASEVSQDQRESAIETQSEKPKPVASPKRSRISPDTNNDSEKVKLSVKATGEQSELSLDSVPRGRFEGENPNVFEGEDLDLPPFLRKKR